MEADIRAIDLKVSELKTLILHCIRQVMEENREQLEDIPQYVYGLAGLQQILHCSKATAMRVKKSGRIDDAIIQSGKLLIIDSYRALNLLKTQKNTKKSWK